MLLFQKLICPNCGAVLSRTDDSIECRPCGRRMSTASDFIDFRTFLQSGSEWDAEKFEKGYSRLDDVEDGFEHARRSGIPDFIEKYRISRCKDFIAAHWIAGERDGCLLDIGCGTGWFDFRLRDKFAFTGEIAGIDVSPHNVKLMIREIRRRGENRILSFASNAEKIPFADGTFDIVVMTEVLEHVADPASVVKEVSRLLKPGGRFIITTPSGPVCAFWDAVFLLPKHVKRIFVPPRGDPSQMPYDKPLSWREIRGLLESAGFAVSDYHKAIFLPHESYLQFFPGILQRLLLLNALVMERLGFLASFMGLHHIVLAERRK